MRRRHRRGAENLADPRATALRSRAPSYLQRLWSEILVLPPRQRAHCGLIEIEEGVIGC